MARVGIVGTGWGTRVQVPLFRQAGLQVVAIAGFRAEKTAETAAALEVRGHDDWRELIASPDVDLVSIVTPPSEHREMTLAALAAGKHVLCEKPTAMSVSEAEEMVAAAAGRPELVTLIDHELRFLPPWRETRERIGEIGAIRYAEVRYSSPSRGDRSREWNWWSDASRGGGVLGAVGSHFADALRYFGMEFESVQALLRTTIDQRPSSDPSPGGPRAVTSDDWAAMHFRMRGGAVVSMTFSTVATGPDEDSMMTLYGEQGALRFIGEEVLISKAGAPFTRFTGGEKAQLPGNSHGGAFGSGTLHLGRALRAALDDGDREALAPAATFADGLAQQRVLDAVRRASASGEWTRV